MDSNYILQLDDYHEHRTDHSDYRHPYPSSIPSNDSQFWPYPYPAQPPNYARYPSQCNPQPDPAAPFICDASSLPSDDFVPSTRLGLFDISAMHPVIGSAEPWGPPNEGERFSLIHFFSLLR